MAGALMMAAVESYLAIRRAGGFKLEGTECRLRSFARFAAERSERLVRIESAVDWAGAASSANSRHVRLRDLATFARHLRAEDPRHELPDASYFVRPRSTPVAHIFTDGEITEILAAAGRLAPAGTCRADTYTTVFGLFVATGMRVGELCRLKIRDLSPDGLRIHETKFRKSRLLPLHPSTEAALHEHLTRWRANTPPDAPFFVSTTGSALTKGAVWDTFAGIRKSLELGKQPTKHRRRSPRIHDFRHTFAVRSLEACSGSKQVVEWHMLALATYLGHGSLVSTYWYLHTTPGLMTGIADQCQLWHQERS